MRNAQYIIAVVLACLLQACSTSTLPPVAEIGQPPLTAKYYTVAKGDTLYAIAWRFDMDFRRLANANSIHSPYVIKPGQRILLAESGIYQKKVQSGSGKATVHRESLKKNAKKAISSSNRPKKGVERKHVAKTLAVNDKGWLWPVSGKVVQGFSPRSKLNKGIDIAARVGTPVHSTRSGQVVYSGSQLKGYGNLVIVRHDDTYLSAYAHNHRVLVKEGDVVKQGQRIAEVGKTGTQTAKLHFEIRKHGKPINPLPLLKKK